MSALKLRRLGRFQREGFVPAAVEAFIGLLTLAFCFVGTAAAAADDGSTVSQQTIEHRLEEQAKPRTPVSYRPTDFDRYVGYYQVGPGTFFRAIRNDSHYIVQLSGQGEAELYPDSAGEFFSNPLSAQFTFDQNADGTVTDLVLHQGGQLTLAKRVDAAVAAQGLAALAARIRSNTPSPGTEPALRHQIEGVVKGQTDYAAMEPDLAAFSLHHGAQTSQTFALLGAFKSLTFTGVNPAGFDLYEATFAHGVLEFLIAPLDPDGKIAAFSCYSRQP